MTAPQLSPGLRRKRRDGASQIQNKLTICGGVRRTGLNTGAPMSHSGTRNLCDMAPSRFKRFADWIIPALCYAVQVEGPILEPRAGRGHMVRHLRYLGFVVLGVDLFAYADSLVPDMKTGVDIFDLESLAGYRFIVTNLPYREQAPILAHLLPIAARDGVRVAALSRQR